MGNNDDMAGDFHDSTTQRRTISIPNLSVAIIERSRWCESIYQALQPIGFGKIPGQTSRSSPLSHLALTSPGASLQLLGLHGHIRAAQ